jgi:hypothetical protein
MIEGARYSASVKEVGAETKESWRRLVITVTRL